MDFEDDESRDGSEYGVSDDTEEERWSEDESEDVDEQEVENHEYTTPGDTSRMVNIRLFFTEEETGGFKWMKNCVAKCTCDGVVVATALARYIYRESMRSEFWENMEEPSEETCGMAYDVFDRYGTLKTKYKDHPVQRGTGVWGNELDHGPLFLIEVLHVKALDLRRKGLGQKVVSLLLQKAQQRCLDEKEDRKRKHMDIVYGSKEAFEREWTPHALVSPGILTADIESQSVGRSAEERLMIRTRIQSGAIDFWRSCGFRRIGASRCFAFSFDLHHQSRVLTAAADFDPRSSHAKDLEDEELEVIYKTDSSTDLGKLKMGRLRDALPLHHAALTLTDEELKAFFVNHSGDETGWNRVTNSKATLLHLTACELKPQSTQWLLDNVHHAESWKTARDIDGYTPLESLQEKLEIMRTRIVHGFFRVSNISDHFRGNPDTAVSCLSLLLGQEASALNKEYLRYGCICGECVRGFLSARMRSSLIVQGETAYDFMQDGIEDGGFWVEFNDHRLEHLDSDVRENLKTNKSLRKGFANLFQIAVECLKAKRAPVAANLEWYCKSRSEWPPYIKSYLRRAGTRMGCRAVLREMFDAAMNEDEKAGNGECQRILKKEWSDLPTCRNDHEFEFVARACGYSGDDSISVPCW
ncbi:zinc knuckle transcription factor [Penicillium concentricum]|uniref:Zinc knuckle transcription factor n=1 Tax=Penicillium concentricum TaxID=293559 RepID=A0A9W9S8D3_9EURO|nr:zinc knuckle transcription factor [Penicillium concentricum]KAJ5373957.1 zinc knuckle transcription factor [Penicillium concentricum]